ncbi:hypothetical protein [Cytobacillus depressus]|nr:hypothetical protein [Cytobacillus depressus]
MSKRMKNEPVPILNKQLLEKEKTRLLAALEKIKDIELKTKKDEEAK